MNISIYIVVGLVIGWLCMLGGLIGAWRELRSEKRAHAETQEWLEVAKEDAAHFGAEARTLTDEVNQLKDKLANTAIVFELERFQVSRNWTRVEIESEPARVAAFDRLRHQLDTEMDQNGYVRMTDITVSTYDDGILGPSIHLATGGVRRFACQLGQTTEWYGRRVQPVADESISNR